MLFVREASPRWWNWTLGQFGDLVAGLLGEGSRVRIDLRGVDLLLGKDRSRGFVERGLALLRIAEVGRIQLFLPPSFGTLVDRSTAAFLTAYREAATRLRSS